MSTEQFTVANVKCGGCVANIKNKLGALANIQAVDVDLASGQVTVQGEPLDRTQLSAKLTEIGYPEKKA
ncbi:MAG: heavy-metal-associated domain-containing protein [Gammaproteobacteria bacterium]|nr:heavy-metal-associated domain-containing protein [Gammaproteobacteria bacterium]